MANKIDSTEVALDSALTEDWKLKIQVDCPKCGGAGWYDETDWGLDSGIINCRECDGGKIIKHFDSRAIGEFMGRPESRAYTCICGKLEHISRPTEGQIPAEWIQIGAHLICGECKVQMTLMAIRAVDKWIEERIKHVNVTPTN